MLTANHVRNLFSYDRVTGILTWKISRSNRIKVGDVAGCNDGRGYLRVKIDGKKYRVHRIVMLIENGCWPKHEVDHLNGDRSDNTLCNLRCATRSENQRNRKRGYNNTSGHIGVTWYKKYNKWNSKITINGIDYNLGYFNNKKDAISARKSAEIKFGFHPNHGR